MVDFAMDVHKNLYPDQEIPPVSTVFWIPYIFPRFIIIDFITDPEGQACSCCGTAEKDAI